MKILHSLVIFGGIGLSGYYGITYSAHPALAQIVPDDTLGDNQTLVKPNVEVKGLPADLIEGGATRGDNLFHSFSEFNVGDLQRVYFANPAGINNILSRVTGSNISKILGTLGVDGAANLFLLNPNGIVFGANASLDVAGSFVASTANSVVFGNGTEFSATNPEEPPLLTINISPGLQYGQNPPQPIVNAGNLAVGPGQNLTLVGGSVISTGDIQAPGGEINLVAVPTETLVQLGQAGKVFTLSTSSPSIGSNSASVTEFFSSLSDDTGITVTSDSEVTLTESGTIVPLEPGTVIISGTLSAANFSEGETAGKVTVLGDQVGLFEAQLNGGSNVTITAGTTGNQEGNITGDGFDITKTTEGEVTLTLEAANDISLKNVDINANSGLLNLVLEADSDNSGSGDVELMNGGMDNRGIDTGGGAVTITAAGAIALESLDINSDTESQRNAGDITITAGSVLFENQSGLGSETRGNSSGDAGNITITAADSVVFTNQSGLGTNTTDDSTGDAGQITITAGSVLFENQSGLGSETRGNSSGDAGNITITAADSVVFTNQSGLGTNTTDDSTGDAGQITITAGSLLFENQSGLGSNTEGNSTGNAGKITITADSFVFREQSGLGTNTRDNSTGDAGEIKIKADSLSISNNSGLGSIASDNSTGNAGSITIDVGTLSLDNESDIGQSGVEIAANVDNIDVVVVAEEGNNDGNITIIADNISLTNKSVIDSNSNNSDQGGDISITVTDLLLLRNESKILADSGDTNSEIKTEGNAGDITITAGSLLLENDSDIESNTIGNSSGDAGIITINADSLVFRNQSGLGTNTQGNSTGDAGQITITAGSVLFEGKDSGLGSNTEGNSSGDAGIITITADSLVFRNQSGLGTNTQENSTGDAGQITITAGSVLFENQTGLGSDTKGDSSGDAGIITITANSLVFRNQSGLGTNTRNKSTGDAGEIIITAGSVLFENNSGLGSETQNNSTGDAGKITITADSLVLREQSSIGTRTIDNSTGNAGTITITADSISLENNSDISSKTSTGDGGDITLTLQDLLILRDGSQISTTAGTEDQPGNGGNITITADFILAVLEENSDITANAFKGNGGNITLTGRGIFGFNFPDQPTNLSDITASSELGVDGNIEIQILDFNPSQGLVKLPTTVVDASTRILPSCAENVKVGSNNSTGDEFIVTGRGGLPPSPLDPIISQTVIADWVTLDNSETENYQSQRHSPPAREESARKRPRRRIVEAQGWLIGPDGTVILTAFPTTPETWANSSVKSPSCQDLRRITNGS